MRFVYLMPHLPEEPPVKYCQALSDGFAQVLAVLADPGTQPKCCPPSIGVEWQHAVPPNTGVPGHFRGVTAQVLDEPQQKTPTGAKTNPTEIRQPM